MKVYVTLSTVEMSIVPSILPSALMYIVPLAFTMLICGRETSTEQSIKRRTNLNANFFTLDTNNTLFNPKLIVFGEQNFH